MILKDSFAEFLFNYRTTHNLSQAMMASILGVKQSQVCQWERSKNKPLKLREENVRKVLSDR